MSYDQLKAKFSREKFYLVEIYAPYCDLSYGIAPCTASGGPKCYNTFKTCQDVANFTPSDKVYRFCSARSPIPPGVPNLTMPTVESVNFTAPSIDITGGLGVRASAAVTFRDGPSADIGIDKYVDERTYIPHQQGTWWGKWRARNAYYEDLKIIIYSGFLAADGSFSFANMQRREYVVTSLRTGNGKAVVDSRDPLKLTEALKAQYPAKSTGVLEADLAVGATAATLAPAGVGDAEYPASGFVRLSSEVIGFTRTGDSLTLVRAQYNTAEAAHSAGDSVQLCALENDRVDVILAKLLTVGAAIPSAYIPTADWAAEASANYPTSIERLITQPEPVEAHIKELCGETCPSYLYWDERASLIRWEAVAAPPVDLDTLDDTNNMTGDLTAIDQLKLRASRVFVYSAQVDPTKKKDETSNYSQTYLRVDTDAETAAGSPAIKTVYSRWISRFNKAAAVLLATRLGRRFAQAPRLINFKMTSKDTDYWLGSSANLEHFELQDVDGSRGTVPAQVVSVAEKPDGYVYSALELYWGEELPGDAEDGVDLVILGGSVNNINLRAIYDTLYPAPTVDSVVRFIIDTGVEVGSTSTAAYSIDTGSWPVGMAPIQLGVRGYAQGKGGAGADVFGSAEAGGPCLLMNYDVTVLFVSGRMAGGGGGGGYDVSNDAGFQEYAAGGGGAGIQPGTGGGQGTSPGSDGFSGTRDEGGNGGAAGFALGGKGGGPGVSGSAGKNIVSLGAAAGAAIVTNGYTLLIEDGAANIKGAIV